MKPISLSFRHRHGLTSIQGTARKDTTQNNDIFEEVSRMIDKRMDKRFEDFNANFQSTVMPALMKQFELSMRSCLQQSPIMAQN
jgi:hypothetical protein